MKSSQTTSTPHIALGQLGEVYAAAYLQQLGFRLVAANFKIPVGRNLRGVVINSEIDLIAYEGETLCFIEVKTRASDWFAPPQVNVDRRKQRHIARAARAYRRMLGLESEPYRYDVITVVVSQTTGSSQSPQIELLKNYFREDALKKRPKVDFFYD